MENHSLNLTSLKNWLSCKDIEVPQLYLVGGTVRDLLLDLSPKDIDLVCKDARDFAGTLAGCNNAALVPMEKKPHEPCYRVVDRDNSDNFLDIAEMRGDNISEDLNRRDFTINAIAIEIKEDCSLGELIDPLKGAEDIARKTIKMTSDKSIVSDPLRILRAVRLAASLNFIIDKSTLGEMKHRAALLKDISAERMTAELMLLLKTPRSFFYFRQMDELGILEIIFPEIKAMKGCPQNGFHHMDVWEHSLLVMEHTERIINKLSDYFGESGIDIANNLGCDDRFSLLKLSALLHDAGKPATGAVNPDTGRITFYHHDKEGARLTDLIAERLKMSNRNRDFMVLLVGEHLHALNLVSGDVKATTKMKWFRKMGDDAVPAIILSMADTMSILGPDATEEYRERYINWSKQSVRDYYDRIKLQIESPDLITGKDLITLGMKPGPEIGRILAEVRSARDDGKIASREEALELAKKLLVQ
jgi:putative nucleotidyltransferase with HDIG domain